MNSRVTSLKSQTSTKSCRETRTKLPNKTIEIVFSKPLHYFEVWVFFGFGNVGMEECNNRKVWWSDDVCEEVSWGRRWKQLWRWLAGGGRRWEGQLFGYVGLGLAVVC